jgi:hypothetical protein
MIVVGLCLKRWSCQKAKEELLQQDSSAKQTLEDLMDERSDTT